MMKMSHSHRDGNAAITMALLMVAAVVLCMNADGVHGAVSETVMAKITTINNKGPYLGIVIPNAFEMNPLLESSGFTADQNLPYIDIAGRRFRVGSLENKRVILVLTGLAMINSGIATQLLLSLFEVKGVVHYGIAGNANSAFQVGDVTIPLYWAHTGLWNWQRYGDGPETELAFESGGDYTRKIGYLRFSDYNNVTNGKYTENFLNNVWYQPEEVFRKSGTPEVRQHAFWVRVNASYFILARKLEDMKLEGCVNATTCLPRTPIVRRVQRGVSASVYVDNRAYRDFLHTKFNATPIDMETAAVALICEQQGTPFIAIRSLSDLAGGGSSISTEASTFSSLAAQNAVDVVVQFVKLLTL